MKKYLPEQKQAQFNTRETHILTTKQQQAEFLSFFLTYIIYVEILLQSIPCVFICDCRSSLPLSK
jgi:hypothetical protein